MDNHEYTVISLGGSMVVPGEIDAGFIARFRDLIIKKVEEGHKFLVIVGGGKTSRKYQTALREVSSDIDQHSLDLVGIAGTRLNAELVRLGFGEKAHSEVFYNPETFMVDSLSASVVICAGWKPGWSTDYVAVSFAEKLQAKSVVNISNVDYVYDSDPRENSNAQKQLRLTWQQYKAFSPGEWSPGLSSPFDPVATDKAEKLNLNVVFVDGKKIDQINNVLENKPVDGTIISNDSH